MIISDYPTFRPPLSRLTNGDTKPSRGQLRQQLLTTKEVSAGPLWLRRGPAMPGWCFTCHGHAMACPRDSVCFDHYHHLRTLKFGRVDNKYH